jgi:hypothetical protein
VVTHRIDMRQDAKGSLAVRERIDIVANPVAVLGTSTENPVTVRIRQGLADTAAEGLVLDLPNRESTTMVSVFARAAASQLPLRVLRPNREPDWGQADLAPDVRARVGQDLAAGYLAVLPAKQVLLGETLRLGWFRVHPTTGETLGVMDDGFHSSDRTILDKEVTEIVEIPEGYFDPYHELDRTVVRNFPRIINGRLVTTAADTEATVRVLLAAALGGG